MTKVTSGCKIISWIFLDLYFIFHARLAGATTRTDFRFSKTGSTFFTSGIRTRQNGDPCTGDMRPQQILSTGEPSQARSPRILFSTWTDVFLEPRLIWMESTCSATPASQKISSTSALLLATDLSTKKLIQIQLLTGGTFLLNTRHRISATRRFLKWMAASTCFAS